jgi:hypothetical protein
MCRDDLEQPLMHLAGGAQDHPRALIACTRVQRGNASPVRVATTQPASCARNAMAALSIQGASAKTEPVRLPSSIPV